ncbi:hypothetical protein K9909_003155 [Salmonella enterica subsp. enterica serovar Newport]|nr:hypothetical protein [Salmonella enterica subsp. enterica serovar Newport]EIE6438172.1 hypothetical protein [Salmonella enterica]EHS5152861.1 hypothetical protein [Salmonella enterica subsp. enterica serovar Newport]EHV5816231.1 hypothetical protein [Salmonella enterica subsp. enterica serovar Newport]EIC3608404.1 hypothetical protein [Salmonella enterica subsp. enterica serovar Newport]
MVKLTGGDRSRIQHLEKRLREALNRNGYHPPAGAGENDYRSYQQKVIIYLRSINEPENNINAFLSETERLYSGMFPSESDTEWYRNDPRASLWLVCELCEELKKNKIEHKADFLSPALLQPDHNVRVDAMRRCINDWPLLFITQNEFIRDKGIEWADLLDNHNLFRDVSSGKVDVGSWLKGYIKDNTPTGLNRICGESPEEVMAWCYASYFIWRKNNLHLPDSVELFNRKFRSAWATQKNRIKNKVEKNLRPLNVHISQQAHDMLREMSVKGGVSNDRIIESALTLMYDSKKRQ